MAREGQAEGDALCDLQEHVQDHHWAGRAHLHQVVLVHSVRHALHGHACPLRSYAPRPTLTRPTHPYSQNREHLHDAQKQLLGYMPKPPSEDDGVDWGKDMFGGEQQTDQQKAQQQQDKLVQDMRQAQLATQQQQAKRREREDEEEEDACFFTAIGREADKYKRIKSTFTKTMEREVFLRAELDALAKKRAILEVEEKKQFVIFSEAFKGAKVELEQAKIKSAEAEKRLVESEKRVEQDRVSANTARLSVEALLGDLQSIHDMLYGEGDAVGVDKREGEAREAREGEAREAREGEAREGEEEAQGEAREEGEVEQGAAQGAAQVAQGAAQGGDAAMRSFLHSASSSGGSRMQLPNRPPFSPGLYISDLQDGPMPPQLARVPFAFSSASRSPSPRRNLFSMQGTPNM